MSFEMSRRDAIGILGLGALSMIGIGVGGYSPLILRDAFAADEGGGGGGHEGGGDGGGGTGYDLGWGYAWVWFDEMVDPNATLDKDTAYKQGWNDNSKRYFWDNLITGPNGRIKQIFDQRAAINGMDGGSVIPTPSSTEFHDWYEIACDDALTHAQDRANQSDARIVGVGWTLGFTGNPNDGGVGRWYMSNDTSGRTFTRLLDDDASWSYNGHGGSSGIGWFDVGNAITDLGANSPMLKKAWGEEINVTRVNDANPGEIWRNYIYRMGQVDNTGTHYTWVVVAVAKGWPESPSGFLTLDKQLVI